MNRDKTLSEHAFVFNKYDNGGESLSLTTKFIANGDPITDKDGIYLNQELSLQSYCNAATFKLCGALFTPENLRNLANELERERNKLAKS